MWCNLTTVDAYFAERGNTDWSSISTNDRTALLNCATDRLEAIPFKGDSVSRVSTRYVNATLTSTPPIPYNLLTAFCELALWLHSNPIQQHQIISPTSSYNISSWLADLPLIIQNALSSYVDPALSRRRLSTTGGAIAYAGVPEGFTPSNTTPSTGGLSTVITQEPVIGSGTASDPVTLVAGTQIPTHYYQRVEINPTITGSSRIQDLALQTGTDNPTITSETYRIPIMAKTNATGGVRLNREFETNFYGTMLYKVDRQVGVNFFSEVIHHNSDVNAGPDFSIYRRVIRPSVLNEASTLDLSEFDSAVQLSQGSETAVIPVSINLVVQASDIQDAAVAPTSGLGTRISDIRFVKAAVRFKQDNDIIGLTGNPGPAGQTGAQGPQGIQGIQGPPGTGGGGGLATVSTNASLTGDGSAGDPLGLSTALASQIVTNSAKVGVGVGTVGNTAIINDAITSNKIADDAVGANELGTVNTGTQGQFLRHGGADVIEWATIAAAINGVKSLSLSGTTLTVTNDNDTSYTIILPTSGGGGGGLTAVASDTSLTGSGTNSAPLGLAQTVIDLIAANTAKTGITQSQANAIVQNSSKTGITTSQANAINANTAKRTYPQADQNKLGTIAAGAQVNAPPAADSITGAQVAHNTLTSVNIAQDAIGLSELSTSNTGTTGQVLTRQSGGMLWTTPSTGGGFNPQAIISVGLSGSTLTFTQQNGTQFQRTLPSASSTFNPSAITGMAISNGTGNNQVLTMTRQSGTTFNLTITIPTANTIHGLAIPAFPTS